MAGQQVVLAEMTDEDWDQAIPNAWLASEKGHPFWLFCIQQIIKAAGSCAATNTDRQVPRQLCQQYTLCSIRELVAVQCSGNFHVCLTVISVHTSAHDQIPLL